MSQSAYDVGISSFGHGFHVAPLPRDAPAFRADPIAAEWLRWEEIFENAKRGDFRRTPELIEVYDHGDSTLQRACFILMAFAGSEVCLAQIRDRILRPPFVIPHIDFCKLLLMSGVLAHVPTVVSAYARLFQQGMLELEMIPVELRCLLGDPTHILDDIQPLEDFTKNVMIRYQQLVDRFGSNQMCIFLGEKVAPRFFAQQLLSGNRLLFAQVRLRFEAFTGWDFSGVFANRVPQPLTAAALAEKFLELGEVDKYEQGVRYFFGHRISS